MSVARWEPLLPNRSSNFRFPLAVAGRGWLIIRCKVSWPSNKDSKVASCHQTVPRRVTWSYPKKYLSSFQFLHWNWVCMKRSIRQFGSSHLLRSRPRLSYLVFSKWRLWSSRPFSAPKTSISLEVSSLWSTHWGKIKPIVIDIIMNRMRFGSSCTSV